MDRFYNRINRIPLPKPQPRSKLNIINIHRVDHSNIGDIYSGVHKYFDFNCLDLIDIYHLNLERIKKTHPQIIICGGGGILRNNWIDKIQLIYKKFSNVIFWGGGWNSSTDGKPEFIRKNLYGIRDYWDGWNWVPCSSCLLKEFDQQYPISNDVVIYDHYRARTGLTGFPILTNHSKNISDVIRFLGSANTVITSSYHGAYWATLLRKKVIVINQSCKFKSFKHKPIIIPKFKAKDWKAYDPQVYPEALQECRMANTNFYNLVYKKYG